MPYKDIDVKKQKDRQRKALRVKNAKENNLCIQCLEPIEPDRAGKTTCIKCTQKRSEQITRDRNFFKEIGICPRCTKNKLMGDEKTCIECKVKQAEYATKVRNNRKMHEEYRARYNEWQRNYYLRLKQDGICTKCAKRKADEGYSTCSICRAKNREKKRKIASQKGTNLQRRIENGLCIWCENPVKDNYKICEYHYNMNLQKLDCDAVRNNRETRKKYLGINRNHMEGCDKHNG